MEENKRPPRSSRRRSSSKRMTSTIAGHIKWWWSNSEFNQHEIAALVGVNQGRVCEVVTGKRFAEAVPVEP